MPFDISRYLNKTLFVSIPTLFEDGTARPYTLLGATATTLAAEKGIEVTGGDKRIVDAGTAVEGFAKKHGATEGQAQVAGAVTAGYAGIYEGVGVVGALAQGPIGWAALGIKHYTSKK